MPKISIIIPVYNSEKYLEECLNSVISQNQLDCEILLINDGSKDKSLAICKKIAEQDNRIVVIDKENGGVSSARNAGLEQASGEYIAFVDSDDWVDKSIYSFIFEKFGEQFDIAMTGIVYKGLREKKDNLSFLKDEYVGESIKMDLMPKFYFYGKGFQKKPISGHVYQMIFKKNLIDGIKFLTEIKYAEDLLFCLTCLHKARKVVIDKNCYYFYRRNIDSITEKYMNNLDDDIEIVGQKIEPLFSEALEKYGIFMNLNHIHIITFVKNLACSKSIFFCIKKLKECMNKKIFSYTINQVNPKLLGIWQRYLFFLLKHNKFLLLFFSYKIRLKLCKFI
jgi:glycosyltransferase involved in cell wall biosynthesis